VTVPGQLGAPAMIYFIAVDDVTIIRSPVRSIYRRALHHAALCAPLFRRRQAVTLLI